MTELLVVCVPWHQAIQLSLSVCVCVCVGVCVCVCGCVCVCVCVCACGVNIHSWVRELSSQYCKAVSMHQFWILNTLTFAFLLRRGEGEWGWETMRERQTDRERERQKQREKLQEEMGYGMGWGRGVGDSRGRGCGGWGRVFGGFGQSKHQRVNEHFIAHNLKSQQRLLGDKFHHGTPKFVLAATIHAKKSRTLLPFHTQGFPKECSEMYLRS